MPQQHTNPLPELSPEHIDRFWSYVEIKGPDECWPWKGGTAGTGYGTFRVGKKTVRANRIAFFLCHGKDCYPLNALHTCDNPPCCNGKHLFRGTDQDNMTDRKNKGKFLTGQAWARTLWS